MKLLLQADAVGSVLEVALELARGLAARGVRVALATEGAPLPPAHRAAVAAVPGLVHHESLYRLEWMEDPWEDVARAGDWLLALERRERPDLVHLSSSAHGALPFHSPRVLLAHSSVLSRHEAVRGTAAPPSWDRYRAAVRAGLQGADALVAPSEAMAHALLRHHGPLPRPRVILHGRDPARYPPGDKLPLVLAAGRLEDEANNAAAVARAAPRCPWPVAIAGALALAPETAPRARAAPAPAVPPPEALRPGQAHLLGRLDAETLARWMGRAAIFAHPARYEPFGLAALEAALCGCALVLGDVESLRELWDGAALFVPPGDDAALAGALRALAADERGRAVFAAAGRARALRLGAARMTEAYLALYRSLGASDRPRPARGHAEVLREGEASP
jgi:glycosyltransferase involved in cell wall biosynthesis